MKQFVCVDVIIVMTDKKHTLLIKRRRYIKRIQYLLMRHVIPLNVRELRASRTGPKVFANGIPNSGTHLLRQTLNLLPTTVPRWTYHLDENMPGYLDQLKTVRNGQVATAHLPWSERLLEILTSNGIRILFMIRDLRDVFVSSIYYIVNKAPDHLLHQYLSSLKSDDERLLVSIRGVPEHCYPGGVRPKVWDNYVESVLPWLDEPMCLTIRFEDLVGSKGSGSDEKQLETVASIVRHLGIELSEKAIEEIAAKSFCTHTRTFRKGQIGDWRNSFTEEHKKVFKEVYGDFLIRLGYEKNQDW